MAILNKYKSSILSCKTHLPSGKEVNFVRGEYCTDDEEEIKFFEAEIKARHPVFYIDTKETKVDSEKLSPLEEIKRKAVAEYLAQQEASQKMDSGTTVTAPNAGMGTTATAIANLKASNSK